MLNGPKVIWRLSLIHDLLNEKLQNFKSWSKYIYYRKTLLKSTTFYFDVFYIYKKSNIKDIITYYSQLKEYGKSKYVSENTGGSKENTNTLHVKHKG